MPKFKDFVRDATEQTTLTGNERIPLVDEDGSAVTEYVEVDTLTGSLAPLASPTFTGNVVVPDADAATEAMNRQTSDARYAGIAYARSGSGAPNGSVTGSVGDRYIDTAATLGARVWYKATGTATNTGWLVAEGDTGWRDVSGDLESGYHVDGLTFPGWARVRRDGNTVMQSMRLRRSTGGVQYWIPPTGFQYPGTAGALRYGSAVSPYGDAVTQSFARLLINRPLGSKDGELRLNGDYTSYELITFDVTYQTDDAWPSSLPGSAG